MSEKDEIKGMIKDALLELHEEGIIHIGCPWKGTDREIGLMVCHLEQLNDRDRHEPHPQHQKDGRD